MKGKGAELLRLLGAEGEGRERGREGVAAGHWRQRAGFRGKSRLRCTKLQRTGAGKDVGSRD